MVKSRQVMKGKSSYRQGKPKSSKYGMSRGYPTAVSAQYQSGPELKSIDINCNGEINNSGAITSLNTISTGVEGYQRVGRGITLKSCQVNFRFAANGNSPQDDGVRIALVYDRNPDGAAAQFSDIFLNVSSAGATSSPSFGGFPNPTNKDRFKILADWHIPVSPVNGSVPAGLGSGALNFAKSECTRYVSLKGLATRYGTAATIPNQGQLLLVQKGTLTPTSAAWIYLNCDVRVSYTDM